MAEPVGLVRVIDGDTFEVGDVTVRLLGIDAPEARQTCPRESGEEWFCGAWVSQEVRARYQDKFAECQTIEKDRYGRSVATCDVAGKDVGRVLVQEGLAFAYRKYSMAYDLDEKAAVVNGRGLHAFEVMPPADYRAEQAKVRIDHTVGKTNVGACQIKGNISSKGTRIFHVPGQQNYDKTGIRVEKGERWFCSESEAISAGWRKARR